MIDDYSNLNKLKINYKYILALFFYKFENNIRWISNEINIW